MWACAAFQKALLRIAVSLTKPSQPSCGEGAALLALLGSGGNPACIFHYFSSTPLPQSIKRFRNTTSFLLLPFQCTLTIQKTQASRQSKTAARISNYVWKLSISRPTTPKDIVFTWTFHLQSWRWQDGRLLEAIKGKDHETVKYNRRPSIATWDD